MLDFLIVNIYGNKTELNGFFFAVIISERIYHYHNNCNVTNERDKNFQVEQKLDVGCIIGK